MIDEEEHMDFIGVDRSDVHPNFLLIDFFNKLWKIALQHGLNFEEFCFARRIKRRRFQNICFHGKKEQNYLMLSSDGGMESIQNTCSIGMGDSKFQSCVQMSEVLKSDD